MSTITKVTSDEAKRDLQIICSLNTLEESIKLSREKIYALQKSLNFVLIPENSAAPECNKEDCVRVSPPMSECAQKLWELNSYTYYTNRLLDEILCNLDL